MTKEDALDSIVAYVEEFLALRGYPPMREEIAKSCGVSELTADIGLDLLVLQGRLRLNAQRRPIPTQRLHPSDRKRKGLPLDTTL